MEKLLLDYLRPETARQYDFYLVPKLLIDHEAFDEVGYGAKMLYSMMLNRAALSAYGSNAQDFTDDEGRVYIIYTIEEVMAKLRCSNKTAIKMMQQLDTIGLIEKKRRGLGKPSIIYVKDFSTVQFKKCNFYTSEPVKNTSDEVNILHTSKNDYSKNDYSKNDNDFDYDSDCRSARENREKTDGETGDKTDEENANGVAVQKSSIPEMISASHGDAPEGNAPAPAPSAHRLSGKRPRDALEREIRENIGFDRLMQSKREYGAAYDEETLQEIVACITDVVLTKGETVKIMGESKDRETVIDAYSCLRQEHIEHVVLQFHEQRHKITRISTYLKTMLYNAVHELGHYSANMVRVHGIVPGEYG